MIYWSKICVLSLTPVLFEALAREFIMGPHAGYDSWYQKLESLGDFSTPIVRVVIVYIKI